MCQMNTWLYKLLILLTPTFGGSSSKNNFFYAIWKKSSPYPLAVKLQEQVESAFSKMLILPFLLLVPLLAYLTLGPIEAGAAAVFILIVGIITTTQVGKLVEWHELRGQSVETWVRAHKYTKNTLNLPENTEITPKMVNLAYEMAEKSNATQLSGGSYRDKGAFKRKSAPEIQAMLRKWRPWAEQICKRLV